MLIVQRPQIEEQEIVENRSRFFVEPLEPGFGYTLGNTLRRTLLSRIPGAAITSVRFEGVQHEFSTVEGVVEDVVDVILNLKQIVLRVEADEPQTMYLSAKGSGAVTAGDLKVPAGVEVVNPDARHHIGVGLISPITVRVRGSAGYFCAGLTDKARFEIDNNVGWGLGDNIYDGTVIVGGNAGAIAGGAIRGAEIVIKGNMGSRSGQVMKAGTLLC